MIGDTYSVSGIAPGSFDLLCLGRGRSFISKQELLDSDYWWVRTFSDDERRLLQMAS